MNWFGRVALCGLISGYNQAGPTSDDFSSTTMRRLQVHGFIVTDHAARWADAGGVLTGLMAKGKLQHRETVVDGFENAPAALSAATNMEYPGAARECFHSSFA